MGDKLLFSFGVIADCQYGDQDNNTSMSSDQRHVHDNHFRGSLGKLDEAITFFNRNDLEFVVHLGDFVDRKIMENAGPLLEVTKNSKAPFWHVLGNHDYWMSGGEQNVFEMYGLNTSYSSKVVKNHRFIILDTNEHGVIKYEKGTNEWEAANEILQRYVDAGDINAKSWNGGLDEKQLNWFAEEIQRAHEQSQRAIVFAHHPIFPFNGSSALNSNKILAVIDQSPGITSYINGHNHFGAVGLRNKIPYVTIPAIVNGNTNAYSIATVYERHIEFISYGHAQDMWFEI